MRWAVVVGLLVTGCFSPAPQEGAPCAQNGACPEGLRCIDDRCVNGAPGDSGIDASDAPADATDAPVDAALTGVQYVQSTYAGSQTTVSSLTIVMPQPQTAGSINVVFISWFSADGLSSVTDTQGSTYQQRVNPPGGSVRMSAFTSTPLSAGANSVTVTFTGGTNFPELRVLEYRGVSMTNPVGDARRNQNTSSSCSVSVSTSVVGERVIAANAAQNVDTIALSAGFVERMRTVPGQHVVGDFMPVTPGPVAVTAGLTGSATWVMNAITLRP